MDDRLEGFDPHTGEYMGLFSPKHNGTLKDDQQKQKFVNKIKSDDSFKMLIDGKYGNFYFLFYEMLDKVIKKQYIVRFLYLCTYMDYGNTLLYGNSKGDKRYMVEKDLIGVFNVGRTESIATKNILIENNLIEITENNNIKINDSFCLKGKLKQSQKETEMVRIFENAIKELYIKLLPREHKKIGLLISILPYINYYYNIVCYNPSCKFKADIKPMYLKEVCGRIGYTDTHVGRLKRDLLNLRVGGELVIMFSQTDNAQFITVNPRVYYKGGIEDIDILLELGSYFDIKSSKSMTIKRY